MRAYWIMASVIFLSFTAHGATNPFYSLYATSLGASLGEVPLIVGVYATVALVAGLVWGRIADRIGRRKPFIVGALAVHAAVNLGVSLAPTWLALIPLRTVEGVASGAYQVASMALMGDILANHPGRARLVSGYRMSGSLAFSVAIVTSGWLAQTVGFRGSFTFAAAVYALALAISLVIVEPGPRPGHLVGGDAAASYRALLRGPMLPLLVIAASFTLPVAAVYSVWPIWIADDLGYGRAVFSQLWGIAAFVEVPCMFLAGRLIDRFGRRPTFVAGLSCFSLVFLAYVAAPPLPGLVAAQVLRGFAYAAFTATALTMAIELAPADARGRASGLFASAQSLASISGSWLGGPLAAAAGFKSLFVMGAAIVLAGAAYSQLAIRRERVAQPPGSAR